MIRNLPSSILNVTLFGSAARNDHDRDSDLDVLVVVRNGTGQTAEDSVIEYVQERWGKRPSLSWYGLRKIKALFAAGDLFAWHLHLESTLLAGSTLSALAGNPAPYKSAASDIRDLMQITVGVADAVKKSPRNSVFETGILYVCARNIAMAASWHIARQPSFGRYSPFDLPVGFPIDKETYAMMMQCRMASQRGGAPPAVSAQLALEIQENLIGWSDQVLIAVQDAGERNEQIKTLRTTR